MNGLTGPVLYPTDFSEGARAAYPYALFLAALLDTDLHVLHVAESGREVAGSRFPGPQSESRRVSRWLAGRRTSAADRELPAVRRETRHGVRPSDAILAHASGADAAAVCMGTHGHRGLRRLFLGSVTEQVIRELRRPVLTVRPDSRAWDEEGPRSVLAAVDLSPMTAPALGWAALAAAATGADLEAVHVVASPAAATDVGKRQEVRRAFQDLDLPEVELDVSLLAGDPASRIRGAAAERDADLIVAATHGRSGPARVVLGSVTELLVRRAPCPVLTVSDPPPGTGGRG